MYKAEAIVIGFLTPIALAVNGTPAFSSTTEQYTINGLLVTAVIFLLAKWQLAEKKREDDRTDWIRRLDEKDRLHNEKTDKLHEEMIREVKGHN